MRAAGILRETAHRRAGPPRRPWAVRQGWRDVLFLHWPVPASDVQATLPAGLDVDLFDQTAWISIVAFDMDPVRWRGSVPLSGRFPEVNVRTYVRHGEDRGVWFYSLDSTARFFPWFARRFGLAYRSADIDRRPGRIEVQRGDRRFEASWQAGEEIDPDPLDRFLVERYRVYMRRGARLLRGDVHHVPWPLHLVEARVEDGLAREWHGGAPPERMRASPGVDVVGWAPVAAG